MNPYPELAVYPDSMGYPQNWRLQQNWLWNGSQWQMMSQIGPQYYQASTEHQAPLGAYDGTPAPPYAWSVVWGMAPGGNWTQIVTSQNY